MERVFCLAQIKCLNLLLALQWRDLVARVLAFKKGLLLRVNYPLRLAGRTHICLTFFLAKIGIKGRIGPLGLINALGLLFPCRQAGRQHLKRVDACGLVSKVDRQLVVVDTVVHKVSLKMLFWPRPRDRLCRLKHTVD